jgi:hypothetical protein
MTALDILSSIEGYVSSGPQSSADVPARLAVIDPAYAGVGNPRVTFEGETLVTNRTYAVMSDYQPAAGDRVMMLPVGTTYVIMGSIRNLGAPSYYRPWQYVGVKTGTQFQNSWVHYGSTQFATARYMIDKKGKVRLSGLIQGGTANSVAFNLPAGFRPAFKLTFMGSCNSGYVQISVFPNGNVNIDGYGLGGTNVFVSLDQVSFFPETLLPGSTTQTTWPWTLVTPTGGWTNYTAAGHAPLRYFVDIDGVVHWSGTVQGGAAGVNFCTLPGPAAPLVNQNRIFAQVAYFAGFNRIDMTNAGLFAQTYIVSSGLQPACLDGIEYIADPTKAAANATGGLGNTGYITGALLNSWASYGAPYNNVNYWIDSAGICHWIGLVKSGTLTPGYIMSVPAFHAPDIQSLFLGLSATGVARIDACAATGVVLTDSGLSPQSYSTGGANSFISLDDIRYFSPAAFTP